jgi:hypothetical protein
VNHCSKVPRRPKFDFLNVVKKTRRGADATALVAAQGSQGSQGLPSIVACVLL